MSLQWKCVLIIKFQIFSIFDNFFNCFPYCLPQEGNVWDYISCHCGSCFLLGNTTFQDRIWSSGWVSEVFYLHSIPYLQIQKCIACVRFLGCDELGTLIQSCLWAFKAEGYVHWYFLRRHCLPTYICILP